MDTGTVTTARRNTPEQGEAPQAHFGLVPETSQISDMLQTASKSLAAMVAPLRSYQDLTCCVCPPILQVGPAAGFAEPQSDCSRPWEVQGTVRLSLIRPQLP